MSACVLFAYVQELRATAQFKHGKTQQEAEQTVKNYWDDVKGKYHGVHNIYSKIDRPDEREIVKKHILADYDDLTSEQKSEHAWKAQYKRVYGRPCQRNDNPPLPPHPYCLGR